MNILNFGKSSGDSQAKGDRWERWANEDGLYDAIEKLKTDYIENAKHLKPGDVAGFKMVLVAIKNLDTIKHQIGIVIRDGKIDAAKSIDREKKALK